MGKNAKTRQRVTACAMSAVMLSSLVGILPQSTVNAQPQSDSISNGSLKAQIGDLGQISSLQIKNNRTNNNGGDDNMSAAWILLVMFGAAVVMQGMRIKSYC